jgi:hypothetical protein
MTAETCLLCLTAGGAPAVLPSTAASLLVASDEVISFKPFSDGPVISERHTPRQQGPLLIA